MIAATLLASTLGAAVDAYGGERLRSLRSVVADWSGYTVLVDQSRRPGPPWDRADGHHRFAVEPGARMAERRRGTGGGYRSAVTVLSDAAGSVVYNERRRTRRASERTTLADRMPRAWQFLTPLLVRALAGAGEALRFEVDSCRGVDTRSAEVQWGSRDFRLHFDGRARLVCMDHGYTDYDGTWVPLTHVYVDHRRHHGVLVPGERRTYSRDQLREVHRLAHFEVDAGLESEFIAPAGRFVTPADASALREFRVKALADGLWFIGEGVMYQLFVELDAYLVALDGSSGDVAGRIAALRERVPDKPVRYVLASHHHADHLHGLDEFVALGATILAAPGHAELIRRQPGLADAPLVTVDRPLEVGDGGRRVSIVPIGPTPHAEEMLAAWLPADRVLFAADLFVVGAPPAGIADDNARALHDIIVRAGWRVDRIVDPHSATIATMDMLTEAVKE